jgi:hypothetical protein
MTSRSLGCLGLGTILAAAWASGAGARDDVRLVPISDPADSACQTSEVTPLDPAAMFDRVVARYQELSSYEDSVVIEQVTARSGERAVREEIEISCAIDTSGELEITTPVEQAAGGLTGLLRGVLAPPAEDEDETAAETSPVSDYERWLAPHMALRFSKSPLGEFRSGIDEGFTPVKAERVMVEDAEVLRLDLQSGDGLSEDYRAKFELFIDPATLLITRIRGIQLLPDGANLLTDFVITPRTVVTAEGADLAPILASSRRPAATT